MTPETMALVVGGTVVGMAIATYVYYRILRKYDEPLAAQVGGEQA